MFSSIFQVGEYPFLPMCSKPPMVRLEGRGVDVMCFSGCAICSPGSRCPDLSSVWWARGLNCPYFIFFCAARGKFSLLSLVAPHCGHWAAKRQRPCRECRGGAMNSVWIPWQQCPCGSACSNPYLELEKGCWAVKPAFLWQPFPWAQLCCPVQCAWGDQGLLGRLCLVATSDTSVGSELEMWAPWCHQPSKTA